MTWHWHWTLFVTAIALCGGFVAYVRVERNEAYVEELGLEADYRFAFQTRPASYVTGIFVSGTIYAIVITAIAGVFF